MRFKKGGRASRHCCAHDSSREAERRKKEEEEKKKKQGSRASYMRVQVVKSEEEGEQLTVTNDHNHSSLNIL